MTALHVDGFSKYGTLAHAQANTAYSSVNGIYRPTEGLDGAGALELSDVSHQLVIPLPNKRRSITGFHFKPFNTLGGARSDLIRFLVGSQEQAQLEIEPSGRLSIYRGNSLLAQSALNLTLGFYYHLGLDLFIDDSTGFATVRVNGVDWISATGLDTKRRTENYANFMYIQGTGSPGILLDDLYLFDELGSTNNSLPTTGKRITAYTVAADTAQKDMVASSGSDNYAMLDEGVAGPDGATTYVSGGVGDKDLYNLQALPVSLTGINLVNLSSSARKQDVADRTFNFIHNPGGGEVLSPNKILTLDFSTFNHIVEVNADTSLPFSLAELEDTEVGFQVTP